MALAEANQTASSRGKGLAWMMAPSSCGFVFGLQFDQHVSLFSRINPLLASWITQK